MRIMFWLIVLRAAELLFNYGRYQYHPLPYIGERVLLIAAGVPALCGTLILSLDGVISLALRVKLHGFCRAPQS